MYKHDLIEKRDDATDVASQTLAFVEDGWITTKRDKALTANSLKR